MRRTGSINGLIALALAALAVAGQVGAAELTPAEARGKLIYQQGETESGRPVTVLFGRGAGELPASIVPCGGCHGADGLGRPEGGVVPPDITWPALTSVYGHDHEYGRSHRAFDEASFGRSLVEGIDPAGNELDRTMPRYRMSDEDLADLIAYMKIIHTDFDAGISDDSIRIGTLLPTEGRRADMGKAMQSVLEAFFDDVNAGGGINGRNLERVVAAVPRSPREEWGRDVFERAVQHHTLRRVGPKEAFDGPPELMVVPTGLRQEAGPLALRTLRRLMEERLDAGPPARVDRRRRSTAHDESPPGACPSLVGST